MQLGWRGGDRGGLVFLLLVNHTVYGTRRDKALSEHLLLYAWEFGPVLGPAGLCCFVLLLFATRAV